jgi:uncharacterized protein (DUF1778 family)
MGEPPKKDAQVHIRLASADKERMHKYAEQLGLDLSELVLRSVRSYAPQVLNRRRRRGTAVPEAR